MRDLVERIAALSPEKLQFLEQLIAAQGLHSALEYIRSQARPAPLACEEHAVLQGRDQPLNLQQCSPDEAKTLTRRFYNTISQQLNLDSVGEHALFLNYGYVADGSSEYAQVHLPPYCLNKNAIKLVLEVIGNCSIAGFRILDVGCGRGGTIAVIARYFSVTELTGLDLSPEAIAFCRTAHRQSAVTFLEGDAEALPFDDARFDAVINIESSHSYPHMEAFYHEVYRVLRPGGYLLYADAFRSDRFGSYLAYLQELGFALEHSRDITHNVLLSCDQTARQHMHAFDQANDGEVMRAFLAVPGSPTYNALHGGQSTYQILRLRRVA